MPILDDIQLLMSKVVFLYTRDSSCWIYNGVSVNPMFWDARHQEAMHVGLIYRHHPMFRTAQFEFWYPGEGRDDRFDLEDFGRASLEGGDVMPIGNKTVLVGISEAHDGTDGRAIGSGLI